MAFRSVLACGGEAESSFQGFQIVVSLPRNRVGSGNGFYLGMDPINVASRVNFLLFLLAKK